MKKSVLVSAILISFGLSLHALAGDIGYTVPKDNLKGIVAQGEEKVNYGLIPNENEIGTPILHKTNGLKRAVSFPAKYDSRSLGLVTPVKHQYATGTCWAHACIGASETSLIKDGFENNTVDLSESHLAYFYYDQPFDEFGNINNDVITISPYNFASKLNLGGDATRVMWQFASGAGPVPENLSITIDENSHLDTTTTLDMSLRNVSKYRLKEGKIVPFAYENKDAIKQLILDYGSVTLDYYDDSEWKNFVGNEISYFCPLETYGNHEVLVVGWDDDYPIANFKQNSDGVVPRFPGAWLCKNSWGASEWNSGYIWISYDSAFKLSDCVAFSFEKKDKYKNQYQYDGTWAFMSKYYKYGMNKFVAKGNEGGFESVDAVGLGVGANGKYHIKIYVNPEIDEEGNMISYDYLSEETVFESTYEGYYSVPLVEKVLVNQGDEFAVWVYAEENSELLIARRNGIIDEWGIECTWSEMVLRQDLAQNKMRSSAS